MMLSAPPRTVPLEQVARDGNDACILVHHEQQDLPSLVQFAS